MKPEKVCVDFHIVFNWHCYESNNFTTISVSRTDVCYIIHDQFFVLIQVNFVSKIFSRIWEGIDKGSSRCAVLMVIMWISTLE